MRRIGILLGVLVLTTAACGSSGESKGDQPTRRSTSTTTKPTQDQAIIAAGLIRAADLPGWEHSPASEPTDDLEKIGADIPTCATIVRDAQRGTSKQDSEQFTRGEAQTSSTVEAYPDVTAVSRQLDLHHDPSTPTCMRDALLAFVKDQIPDPNIVGSFDVSPISVNDVGDGQFAYRSTLKINVDGNPSTLLSDFVGIQVGRFALSFEASAPTTAELAELETTLLPVLVGRMKQAGA